MNEQILKIRDELETTGEYDLTMSRLLNEVVLQNKAPEKLADELKAYRANYHRYLDLLDTLKIDDDLFEILRTLFDKLNVYEIINMLIKQLENHNEVISAEKQIPYFKQVLNEVNDNPAISERDLATVMNVDSAAFMQALHEAEHLGLITWAWYPNIKQNDEIRYLITAKGSTYVKLLSTERKI